MSAVYWESYCHLLVILNTNFVFYVDGIIPFDSESTSRSVFSVATAVKYSLFG